jgi:hypothetical protein
MCNINCFSTAKVDALTPPQYYFTRTLHVLLQVELRGSEFTARYELLLANGRQSDSCEPIHSVALYVVFKHPSGYFRFMGNHWQESRILLLYESGVEAVSNRGLGGGVEIEGSC